MTPAQIEKIINEGTAKERTLLYMTSVAHFVTASDEEELLLSDEQMEAILKTLNTNKEIEYYNNLRALNKVFILFRERYTSSKNQLLRVQEALYGLSLVKKVQAGFMYAINDILQEIPDKETKERALSKGVASLNKLGISSKADKSGKDLKFTLTLLNDTTAIDEQVTRFNACIIDCKQYIEALKLVAKKLPVKPYQKYLKLEDRLLKDIVGDWEKIKGIQPYSEVVITFTKEDVTEIFNNMRI